jgi:TorA maturation chaperone TorD
MKHEKTAAQLCDAIRTLASKPENLENLESYLAHHFAAWLEKYANTPETLTCELHEFANMKL